MVSPAQLADIESEGLGLDIEEKETDNEIDSLFIIDLLEQGNICEYLPNDCAQKCLEEYDDAESSMEEWLKKYKKALRLAQMEPKDANPTFPFQGASTAMAPFVAEAAVDFNARTAPELAYSDKIVKAKVYGGQQLPEEIPPPPDGLNEDQQQMAEMAYNQAQQNILQAQKRIDTEKENRSNRVSDYMNYQLINEIPHWQKNQDKLLMTLPVVGTMYKETYYDPDLGGPNSELLYPDELKFDMSYPTFEEAPSKFKCLPPMSRNEVVEKIRGNDWDIEESELSKDDSVMYDFIKAWTWVDVDEDGLKEPYCIIIWKDQSRCVYSRPWFDEDSVTVNDDDEIVRVNHLDTFTQYQFMPDIKGGPIGMGWGILLGPMFEEINTHVRQLTDAGTLQVLASNSGLIAADTTSGRGNSAQRGPIEMAMGKLTPINVRGSGNLSQNVVQFPAASPSPALFSLLEYMVEAARRLTDASAQMDANPNEAASLYLARLSQALKRPNVISMRVYKCAAEEFEKIALLNHKHFNNDKYNRVIDEPSMYMMEADFNPEDCDVKLVADPSQGTDIERIARAEAIVNRAELTPQGLQVFDLRAVYLNWMETLGVPDPEKFAPPPSNEPDPMQQMMAMQMQVEADLKQEDQRLRQRSQQIQELKLQMEGQKMALEAAKEAAKTGMSLDKSEAEIAKLYAETLKTLVDIGVEDPMNEVKLIESTYIDQQ